MERQREGVGEGGGSRTVRDTRRRICMKPRQARVVSVCGFARLANSLCTCLTLPAGLSLPVHISSKDGRET